MKTRAFLIATSVSALIQSVYFAIITGITLLFVMPAMESMIRNVPANGAPPPGFFNFMGISMLTGGIGLVLAPVVHAGTGALYSWLHRREEAPVSAEQGAMGGAASAFVARFIAGVLVAAGSLLISYVMMETMGSVFNSMPATGAPGFPLPMFSVFTGLSTVFGGLFSACFSSLIAAALGALGGSLTGSLLK